MCKLIVQDDRSSKGTYSKRAADEVLPSPKRMRTGASAPFCNQPTSEESVSTSGVQQSSFGQDSLPSTSGAHSSPFGQDSLPSGVQTSPSSSEYLMSQRVEHSTKLPGCREYFIINNNTFNIFICFITSNSYKLSHGIFSVYISSSN